MSGELEFILEIAKEAGKMISDNFIIKQKDDEYDLVTNLDIDIEKFLIEKIKDKYPTFDIVSEEFNSQKSLTKNCFVIDPIDGTINFANKLPLWAIQIACVKNGKTIASVINIVKQNELFYADENFAFLNGGKINVSNYKNLKNALYCVDGNNNLPVYGKMRKYSSNRRNFGGVCISMSYVACGRIHGASFGSDKPWDYLPGLHLIEKAGGSIVDKNGCHVGASTKEFADILEKETSRIVNPPNIFILHSLNGDTLKFWAQEIKSQMENFNIKVYCPEFPVRAESSFEKFDEILSGFLKKELNNNSIVIAHSIGNPYFVRFCSKHKFCPKTYISVAGFCQSWKIERTDYIVETIENAIPSQSDIDFVKDNIKIKYSFLSEDDNAVPYYISNSFTRRIDSVEMNLPGYNHFDGYHKIYKIPELTELLEKIIK